MHVTTANDNQSGDRIQVWYGSIKNSNTWLSCVTRNGTTSSPPVQTQQNMFPHTHPVTTPSSDMFFTYHPKNMTMYQPMIVVIGIENWTAGDTGATGVTTDSGYTEFPAYT